MKSRSIFRNVSRLRFFSALKKNTVRLNNPHSSHAKRQIKIEIPDLLINLIKGWKKNLLDPEATKIRQSNYVLLGRIGRKRNKRDWIVAIKEAEGGCICGGWTRQKLGNLVEKPEEGKSRINERLKFIGLSRATGQILVSLHRSMLVIINHADDEQTYRSITCLPGPSGYWVIDFPEPGHPCQG